MRAFKEMVKTDIHSVFLSPEEFGELRTVRYDGMEYRDIPVVISGREETERQARVDDHAQGLYRASHVLYCALSDLGDMQPERGQRIRINDEEGGGGFFREFYVASSTCDMGMLCVELETIDE